MVQCSRSRYADCQCICGFGSGMVFMLLALQTQNFYTNIEVDMIFNSIEKRLSFKTCQRSMIKDLITYSNSDSKIPRVIFNNLRSWLYSLNILG